MNKYINICFIFFLLLLGINNHSYAQNNYVRTVVIDAGHGGKDPGAVGKISYEKDIALKIALKTGEYIKQYFPGVKVIYTRKSDKFIELYRRAQIANEAKADLFISIHCDAFKNRDVRGASTYIMGLHKSNANLEVAKKENAAILLEDNYEDHYEGFDPNSLEGYIALAMSQTGYRDNSILLASKVQNQMRERVGMKDRSVREAGLLVLYKSAMPSILVETGYITNAKEERFLNSKDGQSYLASAIYRAFKEYKSEVEKHNIVAEQTPPTKVSPESKPESKPVQENTPDVYFGVQIISNPKPLALNHPTFKGLEVFEYKHKGSYKYVTFKITNFNKAKKRMLELRKQGFKDAFVVSFSNGQRIGTQTALEIQGNK
ncbi:MAG: N-acetylmuramoyl-L-alanine amidase [Bacteroidales bacterium]|nr:N-acetylmuramoyl-L-alanine amidase [Bacteroidales bacterium]